MVGKDIFHAFFLPPKKAFHDSPWKPNEGESSKGSKTRPKAGNVGKVGKVGRNYDEKTV